MLSSDPLNKKKFAVPCARAQDPKGQAGAVL